MELNFAAARGRDSTQRQRTTATSHVPFTDGSTPFSCMSRQPARLLQNNDTPVLPPSRLPRAHTRRHMHTFQTREVEKGKLQIFICQLCTFSPSPPFHKTTLLFPRRNGGWELVIFLFQIKGWQKKNPIHVIVFPYCLH